MCNLQLKLNIYVYLAQGNKCHGPKAFLVMGESLLSRVVQFLCSLTNSIKVPTHKGQKITWCKRFWKYFCFITIKMLKVTFSCPFKSCHFAATHLVLTIVGIQEIIFYPAQIGCTLHMVSLSIFQSLVLIELWQGNYLINLLYYFILSSKV